MEATKEMDPILLERSLDDDSEPYACNTGQNKKRVIAEIGSSDTDVSCSVASMEPVKVHLFGPNCRIMRMNFDAQKAQKLKTKDLPFSQKYLDFSAS